MSNKKSNYFVMIIVIVILLFSYNLPLMAHEISDFLILPKPSINHLQRLSDENGIFEHADRGIINPNHGYCIEDVARALCCVYMYGKNKWSPQTEKLASIYMNYIEKNQKSDGSFHHRMDQSGNLSERMADGDALGRVIWGLGYTIANAPSVMIKNKALAAFDGISDESIIALSNSPRPAAYAIQGLYYFLKQYPEDRKRNRQLVQLTDSIVKMFRNYNSKNWHWVEETMSYDNGRIPLALLLAYKITSDRTYLKTGLTTLDFLISSSIDKKGMLNIIGNHGWFVKGKTPALFDQQPIDAAAMVEACGVAWKITRKNKYRNHMLHSFKWFLGFNIKKRYLYDFSTGGCRDGLGADGPNMNQGAESTIMYIIARLTVLELIGK